jgi:hypothetical protein
VVQDLLNRMVPRAFAVTASMSQKVRLMTSQNLHVSNPQGRPRTRKVYYLPVITVRSMLKVLWQLSLR